MTKHTLYWRLALTALIGYSLTFVAHAQSGRYVETDLVVNKQVGTVPALVDSNGVTLIAKFFDATLVNPWGIAASDTSPFWISQGGAGVTTLYNTRVRRNPWWSPFPVQIRWEPEGHRLASCSTTYRPPRERSSFLVSTAVGAQ